MSKPAQLLLLDTHVWLWFALGDTKQLSRNVRLKIETALHRGKLAVSAISVWEIGMLEVKGRIILGMPCEKWMTSALKISGLRLIELDAEIAIASSRLPGELHGDPADRMLVATARARNAILATADERLLAYSKTGLLRVLEVR